MSAIGRILIVIAAVMATATWRTASAAPLEAYSASPLELVHLSPSGKLVAYTATIGQTPAVVVADLTGKDKPILTPIGRANLFSIQWAGDGYLVLSSRITAEAPFGVEAAKQQYVVATVFDLARRQTTNLTARTDNRSLNTIYAAPVIRVVNGRELIFFDAFVFAEGHNTHALYSYDPQSQAFNEVIKPEETQTGFVVDANGKVAAMTTYAFNHWTLKLDPLSYAGKNFSVENTTDLPNVLGLGRQPGTVWVGLRLPNGALQRKEISTKDGSWASDLTPFQMVSAPIVDPDTGVVIGGAEGADRRTYAFYDADLQTFWAAIAKAFADEQVDFISMSRDRSKLVVRVFGARDGYSYLLVDRASGHADFIADVYKDVGPEDLANVRTFTYAAADGLKIPAFLTVPNGRPAKGLPLVVLPHADANGRDGFGFNWLAEALAAQGYAVLQPQFRGSSGFDAQFLQAGFGQWAGKMQSDLSDGVGFLAAQGLIDPRRVCVAGEGYGGFAALIGVTQEQGVYRCAASISGITDMKRYLEFVREKALGNDTPFVRQWERMLGADHGKAPANEAISPELNAAKASAPILLIHAQEDTTVAPDQSQRMADALKKAGKPYELVMLKGEDHALGHGDTRLQALQALVRFIEANNPPDPPAKVAALSTAP